MLREFFEGLRDHARAGQQAKIQPSGFDARKVFVTDAQGGTSEHEVPVFPIKRAENLRTIIEEAADFALTGEVLVSEGAIVVVANSDDRRRRTSLVLEKTDRFKFYESLIAPKSMTPKDLVFTLERALGDAISSTALAPFRRIDFQRTSTGTNVVEHGRESMGRSVEAAVQKADALPREITFSVPVFSGRDFVQIAASCTVRVQVDMEAQALILFAHRDAVCLSIDAALDTIESSIRDAMEKLGGMRVFRAEDVTKS